MERYNVNKDGRDGELSDYRLLFRDMVNYNDLNVMVHISFVQD